MDVSINAKSFLETFECYAVHKINYFIGQITIMLSVTQANWYVIRFQILV
jgi:hypothetical protein